jgi:hypothetical protein
LHWAVSLERKFESEGGHMRSARLSTACGGSMLALALAVASSALPAARSPGQGPVPRFAHPGAILVQAVDTAINPLAAEIVLPAFALGVRLSEEGTALFVNIPDGLYLIQARHLGHRPEWKFVRIRGDTAQIDFILPPADGAHAGLAEARLRDFLRRSPRLQLATFITRAEIDRRRPRNLGMLLGRIPEVSIDRAGPGPTIARSTRATRPDCTTGMLVFVDGMLPDPPRIVTAPAPDMPPQRLSLRSLRAERSAGGNAFGAVDTFRWATAPSARELAGVDPVASRRGPSALDWIPMSLVGGVEVYPTVIDVPPEFRVSGAECGVVLVWTIRK